ncbi:hypothetical protein JCM8547_007478 [Rhodosporidiobolus lusitaniae]
MPAAPPLPSPFSSHSFSSPPSPTYILRHHAHPVAVLTASSCNRFLLSGDTEGHVALWDLQTFRVRRSWKAHEGGLLGVEEWKGKEGGGGVLTQGRDNSLNLFRFSPSPSSSTSSSSSAPSPSTSSTEPSSSAFSATPEKAWSMPINAMNFCRMSVLPLSRPSLAGRQGKGRAVEEEHNEGEDGGRVEGDGEGEALVAVVSLTKDEMVDIFHLPSQARVHRSVGSGAFAIGEKTGSVMAVHLFHLRSSSLSSTSSFSPSSASPASTQQLHLLIGYESGQLALFRFTPTPSFSLSSSSSVNLPVKGKMVEEGEGWEMIWCEKGHRDAVMSLSLSYDKRFAYTVAADHFVVKYRVFDLNEEEALLPRSHVEPTPSPGKSAVAVREDGKLLATAGWDGELRLYSAKTLSPLAVLSHHRLSLQALAFSPLTPSSTSPLADALTAADGTGEADESSDEEEGGEGGGRVWLAAAGQEGKVSLWEVYPPKGK